MNQITDRTKVNGKKSRSRVLEMSINGESHEITVKPRVMLLEAIRDKIGLTGTKDGCESGTCGACTVLVDGQPTLSCISLAVENEGKDIQTVENLADGDNLNYLQEAFLDQGGTQCGFCTPGMLMSATALLEKNPKPSRDDINKALEGNLCRCTGYNSIVDSILQASDQGVKPRLL
ncbi:MAG: (2Fe-2S)-binding protein [Rhodospirillaceae bacterium]|jgi:aerobic carbon-monoxide dehydrogenase small subunit|nr:(2Fe-2S)-binding protein [Rhodospirillaceae bacterium]MBT7953853.1 (2Fe-2S)-binding protein [Rhodospirillaceae bacterium]